MLKSPNEEYLKIVRLVQLYSIDRCGISISLKAVSEMFATMLN